MVHFSLMNVLKPVIHLRIMDVFRPVIQRTTPKNYATGE